MKFDVSVQGSFYKTIEAPNTGTALTLVSLDISNGLVPNFNVSAPSNVVITPQPVDPFEKWAAIAPQNPARFMVWLAPDETEWIYDQPRGRDGRYLSDNPDTPESESALRWVPHGYYG
jgi:hypothetical protein